MFLILFMKLFYICLLLYNFHKNGVCCIQFKLDTFTNGEKISLQIGGWTEQIDLRQRAVLPTVN